MVVGTFRIIGKFNFYIIDVAKIIPRCNWSAVSKNI